VVVEEEEVRVEVVLVLQEVVVEELVN